MTDTERRAHQSEQRKRQRAERLAAGLCRDCGQTADPAEWKGFCRPCADKSRERNRRKQQETAQARADAQTARQSHPDAPFCPHCQSRAIVRAGTEANGRQRYLCRACGRKSYGAPCATVNHGKCPTCGGRCQRRGHTRAGRQRYQCAACGRANTELRPDHRDLQGGPFPHRVTFNLNPRAEQGLSHYCRANRCTIRRALRRIFREASELPSLPFAACVQGRIIRPQRIPLTPDQVRQWSSARLPDLRRPVTRARMRQTGDARFRPTVLVVRKLTVLLDDIAFAGLTRTAHSLGKTHQETARLLLERAGRG